MKITTRTRGGLLYLLMATLLVACGGGEQNPANPSPISKGTVGVLLTDKPVDASRFVAANASVKSIELIGEDSQHVMNLADEVETIDLLQLKNESIPFGFDDTVPAGTYCKIRLTLDELELIETDDTPDDLGDNPRYYPSLPGNGKLDLLIRGCVQVNEAETITLQLDFDMGKSIHINETGHGYQVRPVVFVDVLGQENTGKLVRLTGTISEVDEQAKRIFLCDALPLKHSDSKGCVEANLGEASAYFDNVSYNGDARPLDEILTSDAIDSEITLIGWLKPFPKSKSAIKVPMGHYPPEGQCRIWELSQPPGHQQAPMDCEDVPDELPDGSVLVTHEGVLMDETHPLMKVNAVALLSGDFTRLEGDVVTAANDSAFTLDVTSENDEVEKGELEIALQSSTDEINGTRILTKHGELLSAAGINVGMKAQVDGVLGDSSLKAALVIVDTESNVDTEQLTGTIKSMSEEGFILTTDAAMVCGQELTEISVQLAQDATLTTVVITDDASVIHPEGSLAVDQSVGLSGHCTSAGYAADGVVIIDDQRN